MTRIDTLSGDYIIFQPEAGQRYTTDDMLIAWLSVRTVKQNRLVVQRFLDLGSGLCSVPMIILWAFPLMQGTGIELNKQRLGLGRKSLITNGLTNRFNLVCADIRNIPLKKRFPLITSSPPYYETKEGPVSPNRDKAAVRFELNGNIEHYFQCASEHVVDGGFFATVYPCRYAARVVEAAQKFSFYLDRRVDVIPRFAKPELISLYCFRKARPGRKIAERLILRNRDYSFTTPYRQIRNELGFPEPKG